VEKARGVTWQRHLYKAITYMEERKTLSEMVKKQRTGYASPEDQGKGNKIARREQMEMILMKSGTESGYSTREIVIKRRKKEMEKDVEEKEKVEEEEGAGEQMMRRHFRCSL